MLKKLLIMSIMLFLCTPVLADGVVDLRDNPSSGEPSDYPESEYAPPPVRIENENAAPMLLRGEDNSNPYTPEEYNSLHTVEPPPPQVEGE